MATYVFEYFSGGNPTVLPNYLPTISNIFTKVSDSSISVNNGDAVIDVTSSSIAIKVNGQTVVSTSGNYRNFFVKGVVSDKFIFLHTATNPYQETDSYFCLSFAWILDEDNNAFVGYKYDNSDVNYLEITRLTFIKVSTGGSGYSIPKLITFSAGAGNIAYSSKAPIINSGAIAVYPKNLLSCSTVSRESTIALPNGKNYFTIGTNNMVELDA